MIRPGIDKMDTKSGKAITVEKRLAVALGRFSTGNAYRTISKIFGIGKSTVIKIVQEVTCELVCVSSEFIKFPLTTLEHGTAIKAFAEYIGCKIQQVVGAIDGTHIEILAPASESKAEYYSKKQKFTINTQVVIGANLIFLDVAMYF